MSSTLVVQSLVGGEGRNQKGRKKLVERMSGEGILYFFEKQLVPEIQQLTLYALVFLILKTTLKCHYASSILQMRKQSRVVKG